MKETDLLRVFHNMTEAYYRVDTQGTTEKNLRELSIAVHEGVAAKIKILAHTLKGSALNIGADDFAGACGRLEQMLSKGDLANGEILLGIVESEYDKLTDHLSAIGYR